MQPRPAFSPLDKPAFRRAISFLRLLVQDMEATLQAYEATPEPDRARPLVATDDRRTGCPQAGSASADVGGCDLLNQQPGGPASPRALISPHAKQVVDEILAYVHQHYTRPLHLGDVAAAFNMNAAYLSDRFSTVAGVTFHHYLEQLRLAQAQELLRDPSVRVSEVAYAVGYTDPNTFRQAFKARLGLPPSAWRTRSGA
jgi:AraC-like DNA-binding protein